jgi:aminopeptidase N
MLTRNFYRISTITFLFLLFVTVDLAQTRQPNYTRVRTYDVQNYSIRIRFDRSSKTVLGDTTIQLKPLKSNFKTLELDQANLKFESVILEPQNKKLEYKISGEKIYINLDRSYSPEELIAVRFKYSTTKPKKGIYLLTRNRRWKNRS